MPRAELAQDEQTSIALFKATSPSVVYVQTSLIERDAFSLDLYQIPQGSGSGFLWDAAGHIVTNFHVIDGADEVQVVLSDQRRCAARVVGCEPDKDLAVLQLRQKLSGLRPLSLGTSADLEVGQRVFAIGNPFGLDQTLTTGIISGLGREIQSLTRRPIQGVIQTDAAINPGNSGGPLLDSAGRLIGVNTSIYSPSGAFAGIGFAVPVDTVTRLVPQLIQFGYVTKPGLGISIASDAVVERLGLKGVLVLQVAPGGPAERAGLLPTRRDRHGNILTGDLIIAVDDHGLSSSSDFFRVLDELKAGQTVRLTVVREGRRLTLPVALSAFSG